MPFNNLPYKGNLIDRAQELRHDMTPQEKKLWYQYLRRYPVKIYKQRVIEFFIVDFYCPAARIAIELDGRQHYTDNGKAYDADRSNIIEKHHIKVMRFSNYAIDHNFESVCSQIDYEIHRRLKAIAESKASLQR